MENKKTKMDINDMKDVFIYTDKKDALKMLKFIKKVLEIEDADWWYYIGYPVVSVDPARYEEVLQKGKYFATETNLGGRWLDFQNRRMGPIASSAVAYADIPQGPFEKESREPFLWNGDEYRPESYKNYLDAMAEYLGVDKVYLEYNFADYCVHIMPLDPDHTKMREEIAKFIKKNGYGPFGNIVPLDITGKIDGESYKVDRRYKRTR